MDERMNERTDEAGCYTATATGWSDVGENIPHQKMK